MKHGASPLLTKHNLGLVGNFLKARKIFIPHARIQFTAKVGKPQFSDRLRGSIRYFHRAVSAGRIFYSDLL